MGFFNTTRNRAIDGVNNKVKAQMRAKTKKDGVPGEVVSIFDQVMDNNARRLKGLPTKAVSKVGPKKKRVLKDVDKTNRPDVARTRLASGAKARKARSSLLTSQDKKKKLG